MQFSEIASRLTGFSTPIFGVSWTPPTPDVEVARRVITFLEDRRVLFNPYEAEVPEEAIESVLQIRQFLTDVLANQRIGKALAEPLRAMRAACRAFLDKSDSPDELSNIVLPYGMSYEAHPVQRTAQALREMRAEFGVHVAQIAVKYGLDVEEPLAYAIRFALASPEELSTLYDEED